MHAGPSPRLQHNIYYVKFKPIYGKMAATEHNKYGPGYRASQVKHHEWRTAENSASHLLPRLQAMVKEKPQLKLLDVGAGSGTISAGLAKYMPDGEVLATDLSDDILARAKEYADSHGVANIKFQKASVFELPFPDSTFDVTHAHQVLCHLDTPSEAIREMLRVTKTGGVVSLRESEMGMWAVWPELPPLLHFVDMAAKVMVANGGQDKGGRQLLSWVLQAGVAREDITASFGTWCYSQPEDKVVWAGAMSERLRDGQMREKAIERGLATQDEIEGMIRAWDEWSKQDDATLGIMNGEILVSKK
ncbi:S-adenosyl-L-methionine-dependent methyltransferase [Thelonectria olida]|uniref:S-adenosyl-L-methionine-dependent methyltransferase n=1 Tax=Thelonectria olida TaxID=1576542 RepID=A0A9P8W4P3_9HYPO|nr:S-adenosyl-L-methionine-dependent methyltransferase [Thelonectria olida]